MPHLQRTPGLVITAGILLITYGSLTLICGVCGSAGFFVNNADAEAMLINEIPGYTVMKYAEPISNLTVAIVMIVAGVGLFNLMSFARIAAYLICTYQIFFVIVRNLHQVLFAFPVTQRMVAQQMQNQAQPPPFDMNKFMQGTMWVTVALLMIFHLAFILPTLFFLSVKSSRDAFAGIGPSDDVDDRGRPRRRDDEDYNDDYPAKSPPKFPGDTGIKGEG